MAEESEQDSTPPRATEEQIQDEIEHGEALAGIGEFLGTNWDLQAGGGGTGGQYMFANLDDLDAVITEWRAQIQSIGRDGVAIEHALAHLRAPADDHMSMAYVRAAGDSLRALQRHNFAMWEYADQYLQKLEASRASIVASESASTSTMRGGAT